MPYLRASVLPKCSAARQTLAREYDGYPMEEDKFLKKLLEWVILSQSRSNMRIMTSSKIENYDGAWKLRGKGRVRSDQGNQNNEMNPKQN